jgi:hypothetical protein
MKAVVQGAKTGLENSLAATLSIFPNLGSKLLFLDIPFTNFPYIELPVSVFVYNKLKVCPLGITLSCCESLL